MFADTIVTQDVFKALDRLPVELHLTGSRYFGHSSSNSDWDFFTQHSNETAANLEKLGFRPLTYTSYVDMESVMVYRGRFPKNNTLPIVQVDVQLVRDVLLKIHAQKIMYTHLRYVMSKIPKDARNKLWNVAFWLLTDRTKCENPNGMEIEFPNIQGILSKFPIVTI
jgi:hypothetical protein